jgi:hypothetical protein
MESRRSGHRLQGTIPGVVTIAPRFPARLLDEVERLSRQRLPIAEINRRVGHAAWRMSLPKPSYEQVRVLVHAARRLRELNPKTYTALAYEVAFRVKPPAALVDRFAEGRRLRLRDRAAPIK